MLFIQLRNKKTNKDTLIDSEEDIRENVVTYDDEGGGEEDTEAFDIAALRNPKVAKPCEHLHAYIGCEHTLVEEEDDDGGIGVVRKNEAWEVSPECEPTWFVIDCIPREFSQSVPSLLLDSYDVIQQLVEQKVAEADSDTRVPPYDSLQTYGYEGCGSLAGSISSLGLTLAIPEVNYINFENWEPEKQSPEGTVRAWLATANKDNYSNN